MKKRQSPKMNDQRPDSAKFNSRSTSTEAQIARLLELLRLRPHHTHELRKVGISHPAGRVQDLKKSNFIIDRQLINTVDSDGFTHVNVALYALVSEPEGTGVD